MLTRLIAALARMAAAGPRHTPWLTTNRTAGPGIRANTLAIPAYAAHNRKCASYAMRAAITPFANQARASIFWFLFNP